MRRPAHHVRVVIPLALVAALTGACAAAPASSSSSASPASPAASAGESRPSPEAPSLNPAPTAPAPVTGEVPPTVMNAARAELATHVGIDRAASATVLSAEAVDWPDGSLGCPQPDMVYPQVITPGYQVVFEVDGKEYDIRATTSGFVMLCESGRPLSG
jgi:hypothetical protein